MDLLAGQMVPLGLRRGVDFEMDLRQVRTQEETDKALATAAPGTAIVYTANPSPAQFVISNGTRMPHVFQTFADPVEKGWVQSYARPGGTATGVVQAVPLSGKRLELLFRLLPGAHRAVAVVEAGADTRALARELARFSAGSPGFVVDIVEVVPGASPEKLAAELRAMRAQAGIVPLVGQVDRILETVFKAFALAGIPAIAERWGDMKAGAVAALMVDMKEQFERLAHQFAMILRGVSPGEIAVHSPRRYRLALNYDVARRFGIEFPRAVLLQAEGFFIDGR